MYLSDRTVTAIHVLVMSAGIAGFALLVRPAARDCPYEAPATVTPDEVLRSPPTLEELQDPEDPGHIVASCDKPGTTALVALLNNWAKGEIGGTGPLLDYSRGIAFAQSDEDRGDDPPHPANAAAESQRVCGSPAKWLRTQIRARIREVGEIQCCGTVCTYGGETEYSSLGRLELREILDRDGEVSWAIDAWSETDVVALTQEVVERNSTYVGQALARLRDVTCPGETANVYEVW